MPVEKTPDVDPFESVEAAAAEVTKRREGAEAPVTERKYYHLAGEKAGQEYEPNFSVSLEKAADDLKTNRLGEAEVLQAITDIQMSDQVDQFRGQQQVQPVDQQQPQPFEVPQPQPDIAVPGMEHVDPDVRSMLENPRQRQILEGYWQNVRQAQQAAQVAQQQAQDQAANAIYQYGLQAAAQLYADFPQLANVRPDQLGVALQLEGAKDPQLAQKIQQRVANVREWTNRLADYERASVQRMQAEVQQAQAQQQVSDAEYIRKGDDQFEAWFAKEMPGEVGRQVRQNAQRVLTEACGLPADELAQAWKHPSWHHPDLQRMATFATLYVLSREGVESRRQQPTPPRVQKPGASSARVSREDAQLAGMRKTFTDNPTAKNAAAFLAAKRQRT
jgi:hypothetical protein